MTMRIAQREGIACPENDSGRGAAAVSRTTKLQANEFSFPSPGTVKGAVLADLLQGRHITHMDCWQRHGSSRIAHHVLRLRQAGWPVVTTEIDVPTSDGRTARIARYSLSDKSIDVAGEIGRKFVTEVHSARRAPT